MNALPRPLTVLVVGPVGSVALERPVQYALDRGVKVVLAASWHPTDGIVHAGLVRVWLPPLVPGSAESDPLGVEMVPALRAVAREYAPDVVHVHGLMRYADLCRLARLEPLVVSSWGFLNDAVEDPPVPIPPRIRWLLDASAAVLVESPALEWAVRAVARPTTRVALVPLGVDTTHFEASDTLRGRWRRALDLPADAFVVFSPRGWAPVYNQSLIFEAFARAHASFTGPMYLVFVRLGREFVPGHSTAEMQRMVATIDRAGLTDAVRWAPAVRHPMMAGLLAMADLCVSVPETDAMPSTVLEAMACEVPCVVHDLPHFRDTVIERGAHTVPRGDTAALAAALLAHAHGEVVTGTTTQRDEVAARYDPARCATRLVEVYAACRGAPDPERPAVSVIIATHERPEMLAQAIDSALAQTVSDREVIVVDDGSTDETPQLLAGYGSAIRMVRKANGGLASARNAGLRLARGRFVAFLDDDDLWPADRLEVMLPLIDAEPRVDVVYGDMRYVDLSGARLGRSSCFGDRQPPSGPVHPELLFVCNVIPGGAVLARYTALAEVGFFDDALRTAEDYDLWMRLSARGPETFRRLDRVVADYRQHPGNISRIAARRMTLDVMRVREKAFDAQARVRAMHPALLDHHLFDLYLHCAEASLAEDDRSTARALLDRFAARRAPTARSRALVARAAEVSR